jgi:hypothetical protein
VPQPLVVPLKKELLNNKGAVAVQLEAPSDPVLMRDILANRAPSHDVVFGTITAGASAESGAIELASDRGSVRFRADASANASLGIYLDGERFVEALAFGPEVAERLGLEMPPDPSREDYYAVLRWGYDLGGQGDGVVALGAAGSVTFGGQLDRKGLYAVARRFTIDRPMKAAARETVTSFRLPGRVSEAAELQPGTWIVAEVDGAVTFRLATALGYNVSWVRQLGTGELSGDVGLKIDLKAEAALRLSASGKYGLVLSRDAQPEVLRLRLYKLRVRGWDFAFNLSAGAEPITPDLPDSPDDMILALLGVHPAQAARDLLRVLKALDTLTGDPSTSTEELVAGLAADQAVGLLARLSEIPVVAHDLAAFNKARSVVRDALERWHHLDELAHGAAMDLLSRLTSPDDLADVRALATAIAGSSPEELTKLLDQRLGDIDFFRSPAGRWLEGATSQGVLQLLADQHFEPLKRVGEVTANVLDGTAVTGVVRRLQQEVAQILDLDQIEQAVDTADLGHLHPWLAAKLAAFFKGHLDLESLRQVRSFIRLLLDKRKSVYDKAKVALERTYALDLAHTYERTTTRSAAIDVEFDFRDPGLKPEVQRALSAALEGDFGDLFLAKTPGVTVHRGQLSHGVRRQSHVEVSLPFFSARSDHLNEATADLGFEVDGTRVYALKAKDDVTRQTDRGLRASTLALGAQLPLGAGADLRRFDTKSLTYSYAYREAVADMHTWHLRYQLKAYLDTYFQNEFKSPAEPAKGSTETWISELDRTLDRAKEPTNRLGNCLVSLELGVGARTIAAWFDETPIDRKDRRYLDLSRALQASLKRLVPFFYLRELAHYEDVPVVWPLLAYAAIPPLNGVDRVENGQLVESSRDFYWWDLQDRQRLREVVASVPTQQRLGVLLARVRAVVSAELGARYTLEQVERGTLDALADRRSIASQQLELLLELEYGIIARAIEAGTTLAAFRQQADRDVDKALEVLANAGALIARDFNRRLGVYGGDESRPLATMLFVQGALALAGTEGADVAARLQFAVLRPGIAIGRELLGEGQPKPGDVLLAQLLTSRGRLPALDLPI